MKAKVIDIQSLKPLASSSKRNTAEKARVIDLYTERKIERFDTARTIINELSSPYIKNQKIALEKLELYANEYVSRKEQHEPGENPILNRFI